MSRRQTLCADCFRGTLRGDVAPRGVEEAVHGLPTYVARPEPGGAAAAVMGLVVVLPDAYGWRLLNTRALADAYAARGPFVVYLPDFMDGNAPPAADLAIMDRLKRPAPDWLTLLVYKPLWYLAVWGHILRFVVRVPPSRARAKILAFFRAVRESDAPAEFQPAAAAAGAGDAADAAAAAPPPLKGRDIRVGVAGFCWGGRYAVQLAAGGRELRACCDESTSSGAAPSSEAAAAAAEAGVPLVDCAFTAHPSLVSVPGDLVKVVQPLSVANGEDDVWMGRENMVKLAAILRGEEAPKAGKARGTGQGLVEGQGGTTTTETTTPHEVVVYEGAAHGFAVRGDPNDPRQAELGLRAEDQAVAWFRKHFQ